MNESWAVPNDPKKKGSKLGPGTVYAEEIWVRIPRKTPDNAKSISQNEFGIVTSPCDIYNCRDLKNTRKNREDSSKHRAKSRRNSSFHSQQQQTTRNVSFCLFLGRQTKVSDERQTYSRS